MRIIKIAAVSLAGVVVLLVICIALLVVFFNPNDYKPQIERLASDNTGRQFTLAGDLKLSVFPWLAVEMGPATLGNAPGFGDVPMLAIQGARLGVRVWPLLRGRFEIGDVRLDGPQILLLKDAGGRNNWSDLGTEKTTAAPAPDASAQTPDASIASLSVRDGLLTYDDRQSGTVTILKNFSLSTGRLARGAPFDVKAAFNVERGSDFSLDADIAAAVTADWEKSVYQLGRPTITLRVHGADYPDAGLPVELSAEQIDADLNMQTAAVKTLKLDVAGAKLDVELQATQILDAPQVAGTLKLAPVSLRDLAPQFGVQLPVMSDAQALRRISMEATLAGGTGSMELKPLLMTLDDTTVKGSLAVTDFATKALRFDLNADRINVDRYLAPATTEEKAAPATKPPEAPAPIPVDLLRALDMSGDLALGEATVKGMLFTAMRVSVSARDGDVRLNPVQASLYEGRYRGNLNLNAAGQLPRLSMEQELSGINFAPLFKALYKTQRVAGRGAAHMQVTATGADSGTMKKALNGNLEFNVADGAIEGFDLWYEIRRARAVLKQEPIPVRAGAERTAFTSLRGSGVIANGVLSNKDLNASLQYLKVAGEGSINLTTSTLDYRLNTTVQKIPAHDTAQAQDLAGLSIPVRITGTLDNMKVRPDVTGYVKEKAQQRLQEEKEKAEQKLKDKLQDKLRGLLGG